MLIDFTIKNFRSIRNEQTFSMETVGKVREFPDNTFEANGHSLLKSALLYGRNSAGKSNVLKGLRVLKRLINNSANYKIDEKIVDYEPFLFDLISRESSVELAISFIAKDHIKYVYEVSFNKSEILKENLFFYPKGFKAKLFVRRYNEKIKYGNLKGNKKDLENSLYPNQLFLSKVGSFKLEQLIPVYNFFGGNLFIDIFNNEEVQDILLKAYTDFSKKTVSYILENTNAILQIIDTGIEKLKPEGEKLYSSNDAQESIDKHVQKQNIHKAKLMTEHSVYQGKIRAGKLLTPLSFESDGTKKFISIIALTLLRLDGGGILIIDELDKSLHPHLTALLIKLFHSKKNNPNNAQLIFVTHDSNLMDSEVFRRDQIWIAEKDEQGSTELYSLADLKGVRKGIDYEKYYLEGVFGGIPVINEHDITLKF